MRFNYRLKTDDLQLCSSIFEFARGISMHETISEPCALESLQNLKEIFPGYTDSGPCVMTKCSHNWDRLP